MTQKPRPISSKACFQSPTPSAASTSNRDPLHARQRTHSLVPGPSSSSINCKRRRRGDRGSRSLGHIGGTETSTSTFNGTPDMGRSLPISRSEIRVGSSSASAPAPERRPAFYGSLNVKASGSRSKEKKDKQDMDTMDTDVDVGGIDDCNDRLGQLLSEWYESESVLDIDALCEGVIEAEAEGSSPRSSGSGSRSGSGSVSGGRSRNEGFFNATRQTAPGEPGTVPRRTATGSSDFGQSDRPPQPLPVAANRPGPLRGSSSNVPRETVLLPATRDNLHDAKAAFTIVSNGKTTPSRFFSDAPSSGPSKTKTNPSPTKSQTRRIGISTTAPNNHITSRSRPINPGSGSRGFKAPSFIEGRAPHPQATRSSPRRVGANTGEGIMRQRPYAIPQSPLRGPEPKEPIQAIGSESVTALGLADRATGGQVSVKLVNAAMQTPVRPANPADQSRSGTFPIVKQQSRQPQPQRQGQPFITRETRPGIQQPIHNANVDIGEGDPEGDKSFDSIDGMFSEGGPEIEAFLQGL
jgi:hypothetical protein